MNMHVVFASVPVPSPPRGCDLSGRALHAPASFGFFDISLSPPSGRQRRRLVASPFPSTISFTGRSFRLAGGFRVFTQPCGLCFFRPNERVLWLADPPLVDFSLGKSNSCIIGDFRPRREYLGPTPFFLAFSPSLGSPWRGLVIGGACCRSAT